MVTATVNSADRVTFAIATSSNETAVKIPKALRTLVTVNPYHVCLAPACSKCIIAGNRAAEVAAAVRAVFLERVAKFEGLAHFAPLARGPVRTVGARTV